MKYQVNMFYSLTVEAESEEQAEEKAGEYIASEEGQGVRLSDMSIEVEEMTDNYTCIGCGKVNDVGGYCDKCNEERAEHEGKHAGKLHDQNCEQCRRDNGQAGKPLDYVPPVCDECGWKGKHEGDLLQKGGKLFCGSCYCDCERAAEGLHDTGCR